MLLFFILLGVFRPFVAHSITQLEILFYQSSNASIRIGGTLELIRCHYVYSIVRVFLFAFSSCIGHTNTTTVDELWLFVWERSLAIILFKSFIEVGTDVLLSLNE